jgi:hypothetical protein
VAVEDRAVGWDQNVFDHQIAGPAAVPRATVGTLQENLPGIGPPPPLVVGCATRCLTLRRLAVFASTEPGAAVQTCGYHGAPLLAAACSGVISIHDAWRNMLSVQV